MESTTIVPEQIIINGQEYSPEDAGNYLELGKKYKDLESKLNTSLDKVYPEYTRATQRNKELEDQLASELQQREALTKKQAEPRDPLDPRDPVNIRKAARDVGLADVDYLKEQGYVRKSDLDEYFTTRQTQQKLVDNILTKASSLENKIDGSDGRVPFDSDAVLAYASAYNIEDLEDAYDRMNTKGNARWKNEQLAKVERQGLTTLKGGDRNKREPVAPKVTDDNFGQLWEEMFGNER